MYLLSHLLCPYYPTISLLIFAMLQEKKKQLLQFGKTLYKPCLYLT